MTDDKEVSLWYRYGNTKEDVATSEWKHARRFANSGKARDAIPGERAVLAKMHIKYSEYKITAPGDKPL